MRSRRPGEEMVFPQLSRRRFLARTAGGAAGLVVASACPLGSVVAAQRGPQELIIRQQDPLNAEPPLPVLDDEFITPIKRFYIRNHGNIPKIDAASHKVKIEGLVDRPLEISVAELKQRFPKAECTATLTCAGNRRQEHNAFRKVGGVQWDAGATGNAAWLGTRLSDLLKHCGVKEGASHVWFDGADEITLPAGKTHFGASIPIARAMNDIDAAPGGLLAWQMNGADLAPEHGYPLRTVVPGYIGARSVKWLTKIVVSDRPSPNHYVATAYKLVTEDTDLALAEVAPIYRFPINVAICEPAPNAGVKAGQVSIQGYALASGRADARITKVEVSANGGRRWVEARLLDQHVPYCWTRWRASVRVGEMTDRVIARAFDSAGEVTPDRVEWNAHGYLYNGWHGVPVEVSG